MKKILVAGAGHGGLSAAYNLALGGADVTVFEKKKREDLGYDWEDITPFDSFDYAGFGCPPREAFADSKNMEYVSPSKKVRIYSASACGTSGYIDRKYLLDYLTEKCIEAGVKFRFESSVIAPVVKGSAVKGLIVRHGDTTEDFYGDLVIDSAGCDSPVRRTLPKKCQIKNEVQGKDVFCVYRAYYGKSEKTEPGDAFSVYFFHCSLPGMDWIADMGDYYDVLVGGFGSLTQEDIKKAEEDFLKEYPLMTGEIIRGGQVCRIPLGRALSMLVCDGYAAVGDSASMTEPLCGSGISLSLCAGKILAETVLKSEGGLTREILWEYQYRYFKECGNLRITNSIIKDALAGLKTEEVDYLLETGILSEKEMMRDSTAKYTAGEIMKKAKALVKRPAVFKVISAALLRTLAVDDTCGLMPREYEKENVLQWRRKYDRL